MSFKSIFLGSQIDTAIGKAHTQGTDQALGTLSTKNPPIDADKVIQRDSTASDALVTSTWTQIKAFFKTYFDGLYATIASLASYIPYTGGKSNVDLGIHNLTVDTNTLFVDATNHRVGIGTTSPVAKLDVTNLAAGINEAIRLTHKNDYSAGAKISWNMGGVAENANITSAWYPETTSASYMAFSVTKSVGGLTEVMRIDNGNVGIGTTTPGSKLEVNDGDIAITDAANGLILKSPDGSIFRVTVDNNGALITTEI